MNKIIIKKEKIITFFIAIYIIVNSGSIFKMAYASELQIINLFLGIILFFIVITNKGIREQLNCNLCNYFLIIISITIFLNFLIWREFDFGIMILYGFEIANFFICYLIVSMIKYDVFIKKYINIVVLLAVISLIGWLFSDQLLSSRIGMTVYGNNWDFKYYGIFAILMITPSRNIGVFWEPGMYQMFLNLALFLIITKEKFSFKDLLKTIILILTIITTYSTTGYIVLFLVVVLGLYIILKKFNKIIAGLLVFSSIPLLFLTYNYIFDFLLGIFPVEVSWKLLEENVSLNTRIYSIYYDIIAGINTPFGIGRSSIASITNSMVQRYGVYIDARTSSIGSAFINYGLFGGTAYLLIWIISIIRYNKDIIIMLLTFLIIMVLINTEPILKHSMMNIILFYWLSKKQKTERKPK